MLFFSTAEMPFKIIASFGIILSIIAFVFILIFYISVYKNKPLGMQTQLDIVYVNCIKATALPFLMTYFWFLSLIWIDPYPFYLAWAIALTVHVSLVQVHAYMVIYASIKAILIFRPTLLTDVPDVKLVDLSRKLATIITMLTLIFDFFTFDGHNPLVTMSMKDPHFKR